MAAARQADVAGLRIGVVTELTGEGYQPGVLARFAEAVELLESLGAKVTEVSCPHFTLRAARLLPDRAQRVLVQPGPVRRHAVRAAGR